MEIQILDGEQTRRLIDSEQRYDAYRAARKRLQHSFRGSMHWKTVNGRDYLYHKETGTAKSLGPRSADSEHIYNAFVSGRRDLETRRKRLNTVITAAAPVDRAMGLGRVPLPVARILRRLDDRGLLGNGISVVGTNAMFAYERMAGGHFPTGMLATGDIDLLFDARRRLRLIGPTDRIDGLSGMLRQVDSTFQPISPGAFRAINADGFMVDLIKPMQKPLSRPRPAALIGSRDAMTAIEIEGLDWLQNAPQLGILSIDERGFPLPMVVPDPRAFALHKLWLSERSDRNPVKARRDLAQAKAVATIVDQYLPTLRFDASDLSSIPLELSKRAAELIGTPPQHFNDGDWE